MKKTKVVCISDTHRQHSQIELPPGDILIHAGDATGRGSIPEISEFNQWLGSVKHKFKHIIYVAGNHDRLFETDPSLARSILTNAIYLEDEMVEVEGLKIYGSPWTNEFMNWSFMLPKGEAIKQKWDLIPSNLDILITHGPAYGMLDTLRQVKSFRNDQGKMVYQEGILHLGCEELYKAIEEKKPRFHVCGHIHDGYGMFTVDQTTFINASVCTEEYKPINKPIVFEVY